LTVVYTVGHSNRTSKEFIDILKAYNIGLLVDVRRFPKSRVVEWSESSKLRKILEDEGIEYIWLGDLLGGFREGGYKAYMETENYKKGLEKLIEAIKRSEKPVAIMCREKLWFKCHRRFISDSLVRMGYKVIHVIEKGRVYEHKGKNG